MNYYGSNKPIVLNHWNRFGFITIFLWVSGCVPADNSKPLSHQRDIKMVMMLFHAKCVLVRVEREVEEGVSADGWMVWSSTVFRANASHTPYRWGVLAWVEKMSLPFSQKAPVLTSVCTLCGSVSGATPPVHLPPMTHLSMLKAVSCSSHVNTAFLLNKLFEVLCRCPIVFHEVIMQTNHDQHTVHLLFFPLS